MRSRIGEIIESKGYMKKYIAKKMGITPGQLSNWITGKSYPTLERAFILAELLEVKVDDLYEKKPHSN